MRDGETVRYAGLVVWPKIFEQHRRLATAAPLLGVIGRLQKQQNVVYVVAQKMWTPTLKIPLPVVPSRDFR